MKKVRFSSKKKATIYIKDSHIDSVERISLEDYELHEIISKINNYEIKIAKEKGTDHYYIMKIVKKIYYVEYIILLLYN